MRGTADSQLTKQNGRGEKEKQHEILRSAAATAGCSALLKAAVERRLYSPFSLFVEEMNAVTFVDTPVS